MADRADIEIVAATAADRQRLGELLEERWGSTVIVSRGVAHDASRLPALLARRARELVGFATLAIAEGECELVTLDALDQDMGIGTALLDAASRFASDAGARRLWLVTSNDNVDALRFYQLRGLRLVAVHVGAVDLARALKPEIPHRGEHGIPVHDELELELILA